MNSKKINSGGEQFSPKSRSGSEKISEISTISIYIGWSFLHLTDTQLWPIPPHFVRHPPSEGGDNPQRNRRLPGRSDNLVKCLNSKCFLLKNQAHRSPKLMILLIWANSFLEANHWKSGSRSTPENSREWFGWVSRALGMMFLVFGGV